MPNRERPVPAPVYSPGAALLSYLVPGLGQIVQGRVGKGLLFLVCLYGLFFTGMYLGDWSNVYIPNTIGPNDPPGLLPRPAANLYNRLHFLGQFWIGIAAWPAIWQYDHYDPTQEQGRLFGKFERQLPEEELNALQRDSDKRWDLGWIYTVIAGVLNILVIYDAFAGPAFAEGETPARAPQEAAVA